jgi:hypothetical protein
MRKVALDPAIDRKTFEMLWLGFRASYPRHAKGYEQTKLCNRIGEKLEAISIPAAVPADPDNRILDDAIEPAVLLHGFEHEKLKAMMNDAEVGWTWQAGRHVERAITLLNDAPEVEVQG